jgi:hypothetical protein
MVFYGSIQPGTGSSKSWEGLDRNVCTDGTRGTPPMEEGYTPVLLSSVLLTLLLGMIPSLPWETVRISQRQGVYIVSHG